MGLTVVEEEEEEEEEKEEEDGNQTTRTSVASCSTSSVFFVISPLHYCTILSSLHLLRIHVVETVIQLIHEWIND